MEAGAVAFLTLGLAVAVSIALGCGLGALVDGQLHTGPVFTLVGLAVGIAMAVVIVVTRVRKYL